MFAFISHIIFLMLSSLFRLVYNIGMLGNIFKKKKVHIERIPLCHIPRLLPHPHLKRERKRP